MSDLRKLMLRALLLDWLGQVTILASIWSMPIRTGSYLGVNNFEGEWNWLLFLLILYPLLGWLFGSYTVLRWRRLTLHVLLQRLSITAVFTLLVVSISRWLLDPSQDFWLLTWSVQFLWIGLLTFWVLAVRVGLRRGLLLPDVPRFLLFAHPQELQIVLTAWRRVPHRQRLYPANATGLVKQLDQADDPILVALTLRCSKTQRFSRCATLERSDPRQVRTLSVPSLFEQQQERLPPVLMNETVLSYDDLPWAEPSACRLNLSAWPICCYLQSFL